MNKRVAFFTDLHIGVHQNSDKWLDIAHSWAEWYIAELKKQDITDIIFGGDFFHYRDEVSVKSLHRANDILNLFKDFNLTLITGNHDSYYKENSKVNSLSILNEKHNITIVDRPQRIEMMGRSVMLCPWGTEMQDIEPADLIVGHFEISNFKLNEYKICDHGFDASNLLMRSDLVFTGHFHKRTDRQYETGNIVYAGNPFQMDFSDVDDQKGYYVINFNDMSYEFYENTVSPTHLKLYTSKIDEIVSVKDNIHNLIIKLVVDDNIQIKVLDEVVSKINARNPVDLTIDYLFRFNPKDSDINEEISELSMVQCITEYINTCIEDEYSADVLKRTLEYYQMHV